MMEIENVSWKSGFPNRSVSAPIAYESLEKIRAQNQGRLSAADVVEEAKPRAHPLHTLFEWDDSKAASHYRLQQARSLLCAIEVTYKELPEKQFRSYEIVEKQSRRDPEGVSYYTTTEEALNDPATRQRLLDDGLRELSRWRARYEALQEFGAVHRAITKVEKKLAS